MNVVHLPDTEVGEDTFIQFIYCKTVKISTLVVTRASMLVTMHLSTLGKLLLSRLQFLLKKKKKEL